MTSLNLLHFCVGEAWVQEEVASFLFLREFGRCSLLCRDICESFLTVRSLRILIREQAQNLHLPRNCAIRDALKFAHFLQPQVYEPLVKPKGDQHIFLGEIRVSFKSKQWEIESYHQAVPCPFCGLHLTSVVPHLTVDSRPELHVVNRCNACDFCVTLRYQSCACVAKLMANSFAKLTHIHSERPDDHSSGEPALELAFTRHICPECNEPMCSECVDDLHWCHGCGGMGNVCIRCPPFSMFKGGCRSCAAGFCTSCLDSLPQCEQCGRRDLCRDCLQSCSKCGKQCCCLRDLGCKNNDSSAKPKLDANRKICKSCSLQSEDVVQMQYTSFWRRVGFLG